MKSKGLSNSVQSAQTFDIFDACVYLLMLLHFVQFLSVGSVPAPAACIVAVPVCVHEILEGS